MQMKFAAPVPSDQSKARNFTSWVQAYVTWREGLLGRWVPSIKRYLKLTQISVTNSQPVTCSTASKVTCGAKNCVLDIIGCQYCFCPISSSDSKAAIMAAFDRDYLFWKTRVEPLWNKIFDEYEKTLQ